ncbi:MAG: hypothetical protein GF350_05050 [Chitinivibrionales bacterium]|nr:hypothetical protein [Chitinivibrionales bacterium]
MKEYALELAAARDTSLQKVNSMREYLQAYILRIMQDRGMFRSLAFIGGTALRFLHDLPRFSEDLDFSLLQPSMPVPLVRMLADIRKECEAAGYRIGISYNDTKTVRHAFLKFADLLYEAGVSPLRDQNISVKIEIDTNPPAGAVQVTQIVNKYLLLSFNTYDIPSLFAGKLHAVLGRRYSKGRDFFDLGWYLSRWKEIEPNIELLTNALKQTGWEAAYPAPDTWRSIVRQAVMKADWRAIENDVAKFLLRPGDLQIMTRENIIAMLERT